MDWSPFVFWQKALPIAPKNISTNPTFGTIRQAIALPITANFVYHRICLTQIKLFRFIGFRFVFEPRLSARKAAC